MKCLKVKGVGTVIDFQSGFLDKAKGPNEGAFYKIV